jgi:hypothetical protein
MSTQEKVLELISKFFKLGFTLDSAKQCALISVDELIKESLRSDYGFDYRQEYWQEVKQEIEKL